MITKYGDSSKYPLYGDNTKNKIIETVETLEKREINSMGYKRMYFTGNYYKISFHVT